MPAILLIVIIALFSLPGWCQAAPQTSLVVLRNEVATLAIKTDAGGRAISYQLNGKPNVFQSHPNTWFEPAPEPSAVNPVWKTYDGGIVWIGPQQDFWTRQNQNIQKRDTKSVWPPDPYQIYGKFKITTHTAAELELLGPVSDVTGIQLKKHYQLNPDGSVNFSVTGTCRWPNASAIDLWTLYRFDPTWPAYGAITPDEQPILNANEKVTVSNRAIDWQRSNDFIYSLAAEPSLVPAGCKKTRGKAKFYSSTGLQAVFGPGHVFILRYTPTPKSDVHPDQGSSEIYRSITKAGTGVLELENHSAYKTLKPGESISMSETWHIRPFTGEATPAAHQQCLRELLRK